MEVKGMEKREREAFNAMWPTFVFRLRSPLRRPAREGLKGDQTAGQPEAKTVTVPDL